MAPVIAMVEPRAETPRVDDEPLFEIIDGQRVDLPPMSILASRVTCNLYYRLGRHLDGIPVGEA